MAARLADWKVDLMVGVKVGVKAAYLVGKRDISMVGLKAGEKAA